MIGWNPYRARTRARNRFVRSLHFCRSDFAYLLYTMLETWVNNYCHFGRRLLRFDRNYGLFWLRWSNDLFCLRSYGLFRLSINCGLLWLDKSYGLFWLSINCGLLWLDKSYGFLWLMINYCMLYVRKSFKVCYGLTGIMVKFTFIY